MKNEKLINITEDFLALLFMAIICMEIYALVFGSWNVKIISIISFIFFVWMANIRVKPVMAWFDIWIGFYWDRKQKVLYFLPIPMIGLAFTFKNFTGRQVEDGRQITE